MFRTDYHAAHAWVVNHDDHREFLVMYFILAVVLSVFLSLFWLVMVVGVHFAFEFVRQKSHGHSVSRSLARALWEIKLDLSFIVFGLVVALYMDFALGLAGLGGIGRLGRVGSTAGRIGQELPGFQRAVRGVALSADDVVQAARGAHKARQTSRSFRGTIPSINEAEEKLPVSGEAMSVGRADGVEPSTELRKRTGITRWDGLSLAFGLVCMGFILLAPEITQVGWDSVMSTILYELQPIHP